MDLHDLIADAKPPTRTVELCLRGDLIAALEAATRDAAQAKALGTLLEEKAAQDTIAAIRRQMAAAIIVVRLEAIPRRRWLALIGEHPPREDDPTDERSGFNTATFYEAIVRASWASPDIEPADLDTLLDTLNDGQFNELSEAAFTVNTRGAVVPFGWRGSSPTTD
jgi:hypothetical protein